MQSTPKWRRYLRFWRPDPAADVDDELRTHLELRVAELTAQGMSVADAQARAHAEFGDVETTRRGLVEIGQRMTRRRARFLWWDAVFQDTRYAWRALRGRTGLAVTVVGTVSSVVAATAVITGIVDRLVLSPPLHIAAPEAVGQVYVTFTPREGEGRTVSGVPYRFVEIAQGRARGFRAAAVTSAEVSLGTGPGAVELMAQFASPGYFALLGTRPTLGRFFTDEEAHLRSGARVAVLGHRTWQRRFGGDVAIVGRDIVVGGVRYTVVGVAPRSFHGTTLGEVGVWLPSAALYEGPNGAFEFSAMGNWRWSLVVRRTPGVSAEQVAAELSALFWGQVDRGGTAGLTSTPGARARVLPTTGALGSDARRTPEATVALWLAAVTGLLLVIASINIAGLLLLRAAGRRHEFAVRLALGVGRGRLATQLLVESLLLATAGGVGALILTATAGAWAQRVLLPQVAWDLWTVDMRLLGVTLAVLLGTAMVTGLAPAIYAVRANLRGSLASGGSMRGATARPILQRPLLVIQSGLSLVLLVGAGLFVRSLHNLRTTELGIEPQHVVAVSGDFEAVGWTPQQITAYLERARARLRLVPGVEASALAGEEPLARARGGGNLRLPGVDAAVSRQRASGAVRNDVTPEFFTTMGTPLVTGRLFSEHDVRGSPPVTIVSESMARRLWPDGSPIGRCFHLSQEPDCWTVVGIVRDVHLFRVVEEAVPQYYLPLAQSPFTGHPTVLLVRTSDEAVDHIAAVRHALRGTAPDEPFLDVHSLEDALDPEARPWRLGATMFSAYAIFALVLAALGLYSLMGFVVASRTQEIGVRMALGATARQVLGLVMREGLVVCLVGIVAGLPIALFLGARVQDLLLDVGPFDMLVLGGAAALLTIAAGIACLVPARRATRVNPTQALRAE